MIVPLVFGEIHYSDMYNHIMCWLFSYHYRNWNNLQFVCVCTLMSQKETGKPKIGHACVKLLFFIAESGQNRTIFEK